MIRLASVNKSVPVVGILLALTAILRLINISGSPTRLDDEGTYIAQAYAVSQWGELAHYTYWYDHPPAGWLQLALWMSISGPGFGGNSVVAGRYLMVIVAVVSAGLLWALARRTGLSRWASAAAVAIFAASPLAISLGRSVYLDNLAIAWLLGSLVLICSPRHRLSAIFGAAACFGVSVLTKETMLLFVPIVAWLVWIKTAPATRRYALAVFTGVFAVVVGTYLLMALVRGELVPGSGHVSLWEGIKFQLWQRADSGALSDPQSLKRHTIDEWLQLDPILPLLAAPIAVTALFVKRLAPFAVGVVILFVTIVRPGYLPVPFVIAALPLTALLAAGIGEEGLSRLRVPRSPQPVRSRRLRVAATAAAFVGSLIVSLWVPSYHTVLATDDDASLRQAQLWISENVPHRDRLIVDDAMWVDLVRDRRDRRNVIWSYKVDTDEQVQRWAPHGWADYGWVVSTPSMRANMPEKGVLTDAMSHARPVATFGSGGKRVDVLRVDTASPSPNLAPPAVPAFGTQVAGRLDPASDPDAVAALQSRTIDQRILATVAVLAATQPVVLKDVSSVAVEEEVAGTPQREFTLGGPRGRLQTFAAFFQGQVDPFAPESVTLTDEDLTVRFPARATDIGLGDSAPPADGAAAIRVADMRRAAPAERLEFIRLDGTAVGSLPSGGVAGYRALPAGTYVMMTVGARGEPRVRQAFTVEPGTSYTLALFSAAESEEVAAQLAPDRASQPGSAVRLLHAGPATGSVRLTLANAGGGSTVLADNAGYGLITGYAPVQAGPYDAVVSANGRDWHSPVALTDGPNTLTLTDGAEGPAVQSLPDAPVAAAPLDAPALTLPPAGGLRDQGPSKAVANHDPWRKVVPVVLAVLAIVGAGVMAAKAKGRQQG